MKINYLQQQRVLGKTALVTGAAQGLGAAISHCLAQHGATVIATDINQAKLEEQFEGVDGVLCLALDVRQEKQWQEVVEQIKKQYGQLQVLVNNAGIASMGNVEDVDLDTWRNTHAINLDGVFLGCKHSLPLIKHSVKKHPHLGGSIINISSIAGIIANENLAAYNSSKAAVRHLTKSVALHGAHKGFKIRCNSVHPVFIDTPIIDPLVERLGQQGKEVLAQQIPIGQIGEVQDVAYAVLYLASDESKMVTGSELLIDGGISAQ